jgi:hypothetical protein
MATSKVCAGSPEVGSLDAGDSTPPPGQDPSLTRTHRRTREGAPKP